jgi:hypothetical protein
VCDHEKSKARFDIRLEKMDALTIHRLHFAFTVTFHYIFPQCW